jgi:hypothetical protein
LQQLDFIMIAFRITTSLLAITATMGALSLAACNKVAPTPTQETASADMGNQPVTAPPIASLPLATAMPPAAAPAAPLASALPPAQRPIRVAPKRNADRYRYTDRAFSMGQAFGDTPPDYTVDYQGTRPWVWRADNGGYRVVEQLPQGQRDYYYQSGAEQPFYITDPEGGYAYDRGELVGVYGPDGVPLDDRYAGQRADAAARYFERARALYRAAQYDRRQAAYAADWQARRERAIEQRRSWEAAHARDAEWQAWHDANQDRDYRNWDEERSRRSAYAASIAVGAGAAAIALTRNNDRGAGNRIDNAGYTGEPTRNVAPSGYARQGCKNAQNNDPVTKSPNLLYRLDNSWI